MARETASKLAQGKAVAAPERPRNSLQIRQDNVASLIKRMTPEMAAALPKHLTAERMARIATTVMRQTPKLAECDEASLLGAIMTCAQLGLEPGPTGQAYLVPYGRECTFILGYKGMMELARRSGVVETIYAEPVFALDEFEYEKGLNPTLRHVPYTGEEEEGSPANPFVFVYAVVKYKDGGFNFVVLSKAQVEKYRRRGKSPNSPMWRDDYVAAAMKTAIRRLATWMPQSVEFQTALAADESRRHDWNNPAALDDIAVQQSSVMDGEVVKPQSAPPANMNPATGEVPEQAEADHDSLWPEVKRPGSGS